MVPVASSEPLPANRARTKIRLLLALPPWRASRYEQSAPRIIKQAAAVAISRLIGIPVALQNIGGKDNYGPYDKGSKPVALRLDGPFGG